MSAEERRCSVAAQALIDLVTSPHTLKPLSVDGPPTVPGKRSSTQYSPSASPKRQATPPVRSAAAAAAPMDGFQLPMAVREEPREPAPPRGGPLPVATGLDLLVRPAVLTREEVVGRSEEILERAQSIDTPRALDDARMEGAVADSVLRKEWTLEDDKIILEAVAERGLKWRQIAAMLPGRSDDAVRNRWNRIKHGPVLGGPSVYHCSKCGQIKKAHRCLVADEDAAANDPSKLDDKDGKKPKQERVGWTSYEDEQIVRCVEEFGCRWLWIATRIPGRTEHAIRNRWHRLQAMGKGLGVGDKSPSESRDSEAYPVHPVYTRPVGPGYARPDGAATPEAQFDSKPPKPPPREDVARSARELALPTPPAAAPAPASRPEPVAPPPKPTGASDAPPRLPPQAPPQPHELQLLQQQLRNLLQQQQAAQSQAQSKAQQVHVARSVFAQQAEQLQFQMQLQLQMRMQQMQVHSKPAGAPQALPSLEGVPPAPCGPPPDVKPPDVKPPDVQLSEASRLADCLSNLRREAEVDTESTTTEGGD